MALKVSQLISKGGAMCHGPIGFPQVRPVGSPDSKIVHGSPRFRFLGSRMYNFEFLIFDLPNLDSRIVETPNFKYPKFKLSNFDFTTFKVPNFKCRSSSFRVSNLPILIFEVRIYDSNL